MTVLGIMKNLFKKKFRVYRDDLQKLMQSISIEKVKDVLKNGPRKLKESVQKSLEKTSEKNWYYKAAKSCEKVNDAVLREDKGFTRRATKAFAGKVGAAGASAGIFAMASMFGSASTGTALGTLYGVAFSSASLAWFSGGITFWGMTKMTIGAIVVGVISFVGAIVFLFTIGFLLKKSFGKSREISELEEKEKNIIYVCLQLAKAFRLKEKEGKSLNPLEVEALYGEALKPLCEELEEFERRTKSWPYMAKKRLKKSIKTLNELKGFLKKSYKFVENSYKHVPNVTVGIVSAVTIQLLSEIPTTFDANEEKVLEALRGHTNDLTDDANVEEISKYLKELKPDQLKGLVSSITGKYHELRYEMFINSQDNNLRAELFDDYNHPGADIKLINTETGEVREFQLKATNYLSYIKEHNKKYKDIDVLATEEVAADAPDIGSTGFYNKDLREEVEDTLDKAEGSFIGSEVLSSMTVAAMIILARKLKVILKGSKMTNDEKSKLVQDVKVAAGVAGVISLLIG